MLRQGDAPVFKKYSQMKLQMKREALAQHHLVAGISPNVDSPIRVTHRRFKQLIGMTLAAHADGHNRSRQKISGPRS